MEKDLRFNSIIQNVEKINPLFSKAKIRVLYKGHNRNGSYFDKEDVMRNIHTIFNIPIVGEYLEESDNFGGHGMAVEVKNDEVKFVQHTKPYGVIPESAQVYWEDIAESDGTVNEYLVVDGAYLWTGRYEELQTLLDSTFNQSMEVNVVNGNYAVIDGVETFKIEDFNFSAFCILGINKNGEGHVEPAFESASITTYSLNKEDFTAQFNQMIDELKFSLDKGGKDMTEIIKEENVNSSIELNENGVKITAENIEITNADETAEFTEDTATTVVNETAEVKDATTEEDLQEEVTVDKTETETEKEDAVEDVKEDFEAKYNDLSGEFTKLQTQLDELKSYKRQREEADVKEKFADKITEDEFSQVFEAMKDAEIQDVEDKLFAMYGKKNFSITTKQEAPNNKLKFSQEESKEYNPYGNIFE